MLGLVWSLVGCGAPPTLTLLDAQNYHYTSELVAPCQPVKAQSELTITWDGLDEDLLGVPADPSADVDVLAVARFASLSREEVLARINDGVIAMKDVTAAAQYEPPDGVTTAAISAFGYNGTLLDVAQIDPAGGTFLLDAASTTADGRPLYLTFTFLCPDPAEENTTVTLASDSASLSFDVDLQSLTPIALDGARDAEIDWSDLETAGNGGELVPFDIDRMRVFHTAGDAAALEADLLHAEPLGTWTADVSGWGHWPLSGLTDADGGDFPGVDGEGTWWLALDCSTCLNPAPLFLGRLDR